MDHRGTPASSIHRVCLSGVVSRYAPLLMLAGICLALGLGLLFLSFQRPDSGTFLPAVIILAATLPWFIPVYLGLSKNPSEMEVSPAGFSWKDSQGDHRAGWDEVSELYRLERVVNQTFKEKKIRIVLNHGVQVTVDQCLSDYDRLADTAQLAAASAINDRKRAALDQGADFGPVTLRSTGMSLAGKSYTWDQIQEYLIFNGSLLLVPANYRGGACEQVLLSDVPNYAVLINLLLELGHPPVEPGRSVLFAGRR